MARFPRLEVLNRIVEVGLVPVFYHGDIEVASQVLAACAAGGLTVFEFTNRGDHAIDVFQALERRAAQQTPGLILGAGSIVDEATAALFVAHGANFIVGPSFNLRNAPRVLKPPQKRLFSLANPTFWPRAKNRPLRTIIGSDRKTCFLLAGKCERACKHWISRFMRSRSRISAACSSFSAFVTNCACADGSNEFSATLRIGRITTRPIWSWSCSLF